MCFKPTLRPFLKAIFFITSEEEEEEEERFFFWDTEETRPPIIGVVVPEEEDRNFDDDSDDDNKREEDCPPAAHHVLGARDYASNEFSIMEREKNGRALPSPFRRPRDAILPRVLRDERETVRNRAGTPQESRVRTDGVRGREKNNFVGRRIFWRRGEF